MGKLTVTGRELCILLHEFKYKMYKWTESPDIYFMFRPDLMEFDMNRHLNWKTLGGIPIPWSADDHERANLDTKLFSTYFK